MGRGETVIHLRPLSRPCATRGAGLQYRRAQIVQSSIESPNNARTQTRTELHAPSAQPSFRERACQGRRSPKVRQVTISTWVEVRTRPSASAGPFPAGLRSCPTCRPSSLSRPESRKVPGPSADPPACASSLEPIRTIFFLGSRPSGLRGDRRGPPCCAAGGRPAAAPAPWMAGGPNLPPGRMSLGNQGAKVV
jgi:hypothetical protein